MPVARKAILALLLVLAIGVAGLLLRLGCRGAVPTDFEDRVLRGTSWRLPDSDTIEGVVLDPRSLPVPGATVMLERVAQWPDYPDVPEKVVRETESDVRGRFRVTGLPLGTYDIVAYTDGLCGYSTGHASRIPHVRRLGGTVCMRPSGKVSGTVRTATGKPVPGAKVGVKMCHSVSLRSDYPAFATPLWTLSDENGQFTLEHVMQPEVLLFAEADGYSKGFSEWVGSPSDQVEIILTEGGQVSGRLTHAETGEPVAGQWVLLTTERNRRGYRAALTDAEGRFSLSHCRPRLHRVLVGSKDYVIPGPGPVRVMVREGEEVADLNVPVVEAGRVAGCVYDADSGKGIEGVCLRARAKRPSASNPSSQAVTRVDGSYVIEGVTPGSNEIDYDVPPGYPKPRAGQETEVRCSVKSGETVTGVDFALCSGSRIRGRFVDPDGGGIPRVSFNAVGTISCDSGTTDNEGWFTVAGYAPAEEVTFVALGFGQLGGYYPDCFVDGGPPTVVLPPKGDLDGVEVTVPPPARVSGVVLDAAGEPVEGARVVAKDFKGRTVGKSGKTKEKGVFLIFCPDGRKFFLQAKRFFKMTPVDIAPVIELGWSEECEDVPVYLEPPLAAPAEPAVVHGPEKQGAALSETVTAGNGEAVTSGKESQ